MLIRSKRITTIKQSSFSVIQVDRKGDINTFLWKSDLAIHQTPGWFRFVRFNPNNHINHRVERGSLSSPGYDRPNFEHSRKWIVGLPTNQPAQPDIQISLPNRYLSKEKRTKTTRYRLTISWKPIPINTNEHRVVIHETSEIISFLLVDQYRSPFPSYRPIPDGAEEKQLTSMRWPACLVFCLL